MRKTKFTSLADELTESITSGRLRPGDAILPQHQLARQHGLSRSCVQKALDLLDAKGLVEKRPGKGVYVRTHARQESSQRSIAYLLHPAQKLVPNDLDNFGLDILWGMEERSRELNINFLIRRCFPDDTSNIISIIRNLHVDGVILDRNVSKETVKMISSYGMPVVVAGRVVNAGTAGASALNIVDSFSMLLSKCEECGIGKVTIMYSSGYIWSDEFGMVKHKVGCSFGGMDVKFVDWFDPDVPISTLEEDALFEGLMTAVAREGNLPEVFVFMSDWHAMKAITIFGKNGVSVPQGAGVIGMFGLALGKSCSPTLTTLAIDPTLIGRKAVDILAGMIAGKPPVVERLPLALVERESFVFKRINPKLEFLNNEK